MIIISDGENNHEIKPTIFPDGTSQVWQLPEWVFQDHLNVTWFFENEAEIIHLMQLNALIPWNKAVELKIPYLPYARQDKEISNSSTFSGLVLIKLLNSKMFMNVTKIETVDVHSDVFNEIMFFENRDVRDFHKHVIQTVDPDYIVFPDAGAAKRYPYLMKNPHIVFKKTRNQQTGEITGHEPERMELIRSGDKFLMVDDLVDGGATFCSISKLLHEVNPNIEVNLAVTHGLFSKGKDVLHKAGIERIFTTNSLLRNKEGFKVV